MRTVIIEDDDHQIITIIVKDDINNCQTIGKFERQTIRDVLANTGVDIVPMYIRALEYELDIANPEN